MKRKVHRTFRGANVNGSGKRLSFYIGHSCLFIQSLWGGKAKEQRSALWGYRGRSFQHVHPANFDCQQGTSTYHKWAHSIKREYVSSVYVLVFPFGSLPHISTESFGDPSFPFGTWHLRMFGGTRPARPERTARAPRGRCLRNPGVCHTKRASRPEIRLRRLGHSRIASSKGSFNRSIANQNLGVPFRP